MIKQLTDSNQAEGTRRWQIASSFDPELLEDCPLNVLRQFTAEQEWVLEPGDMLYLPPNVAHRGGAELFRNPWTRLTWIENKNGARLYAASQPYECEVWLAEALCQGEDFTSVPMKLDQSSLDTLVALINNGHFVLIN